MDSCVTLDRSISNGVHPERRKGVYFLSDLHVEKIYGPDVRAEIAGRVDVSPSVLTPKIYMDSDETWPEVEMIFSGWGMTTVDEVFLSRFPNLGIIFYAAGSVRSFVTDAFWQSGIRLTSSTAANAIPVTEYTCAQIIHALKRVWQTALYIRKERKFPAFHTPPGAYMSTVGLLSLGMIGQMVAEKLQSYDLKIVAYDPFVRPELAASMGVALLPLDDVFSQADVVSCHTPWLPETERMIRGYHFEALKPEATFINTARGAVVAEDEMIEVLQRRSDILAVLDVTYPEPPVSGSLLYTLENVVLTPHIAGSMGQECLRMGKVVVEELDRYLSGQPLRFELDEKRAATMA